MVFQLRAMQAGDLPAVQDLWVAAWQATMPEIDWPARRDWLALHLAALAHAGAACLVAECRVNETAGRPEGLLAWFPEGGLIEQLAVAPARFGAGAAGALLGAAKRARPQGLHLLVNQENPRAVAFYRREGFRVVGASTNPGGARPVWRMAWAA